MAATAEPDLYRQAPTQSDLMNMLEWFWHPVATLQELRESQGIMATRLLGRDLVVAELGRSELGRSKLAVLPDRCPHRSTRLSVGCVDGGAIRCAYHGWRWDLDGRCVEIPSLPERAVPARFSLVAFEAEERYGLVWACLRPGSPASIPALPAAEDPAMRLVAGEPYVWPTGAARRVENFVDLAHFAWVHHGTLGDRNWPVPPEAEVVRQNGEMRFRYEPPPMGDIEETALVGTSSYRMPMPLTVNIEFDIVGRPGVVRHLWMTAAPVDPGVCRSYWFVARNDDVDGRDEDYLDFQQVVLDEDRPVVCNQVPAEIPLDPTAEFHVKADRISLEYRRWLRELVWAAEEGPTELRSAINGGRAGEVAAGSVTRVP